MELKKSINFKSLSFINAKRSIFKKKSFFISFVILLFIFLMAVIGPHLSSHTYFENHLQMKNLPPSLTFWFGTDELGRDIFTRLCYGARISLAMGICAALIDVLIGAIYGAISALMGKLVDEIMMRICDIIATIPYLLSAILLMVIMKPGIKTILIALILRGWINMARIIRSEILSLKTLPFVLAAKMMGASVLRIIFRHLFPNCLGSIITVLTISIPLAIFKEAFLSFLGLGIQAPFPSLGVMINDGLYAARYYPWRLFFPAVMISLTMFAFNLLGNCVRDGFDQRLKDE